MPRRIGRYELGDELGAGGMGIVYSATDTILSNTVAVKVLRAQEDQANNAVARFEREARATAKLGHPNIVRVMDMGRTDDGGAFLVMELLTGETLDETLAREGPLSVERAVRIHLQLLDALSAAHSEGVLHRDVKPSNVFVTHLADGTELVKLLDFGLAYLMEEAASKRLTATGIAMGTPAYMSPERITGSALDHRSDIYSVGVSLFRALTGELPFHADTGIALRGRILLVEAPMLSEARPELSGTIADVVAMSLAKNPDDRYGTAQEMADALRAAVALVEPSLAKAKPSIEADPAFREAPTRANTKRGAADLESGPKEKENADTLLALGDTERPSPPDEPDAPRTWKASTIRGHGVSLPPDDEADASERPPTLPLGGVSVPPQARLSAPTFVPPERTEKAASKRPTWLTGVAIGVGAGVMLLFLLYLWQAGQTPTEPTEPIDAPRLETPTDVTAPPGEPPRAAPVEEPPRGLTPPPPPTRPQLPTTSLEDAPPVVARTTRRQPRREPAPVAPTTAPAHARTARRPPPLDGPLEPDWATPMP